MTNVTCPNCGIQFSIRVKSLIDGTQILTNCPECEYRWKIYIDINNYDAIKGAPWREEFLRRVKIAYQIKGIKGCNYDRLHGLPIFGWVPPNSPYYKVVTWRKQYLNSAKELCKKGILYFSSKTGRRGNQTGFIPANSPEVVLGALKGEQAWMKTERMPEIYSNSGKKPIRRSPIVSKKQKTHTKNSQK